MPYKNKRRPRRYRKAKKTLGKPMARAVKAIVNRTMNKVVETKAVDYITEAIVLNHNVPQTIDNDLFYSSHGVADSASSQASAGTTIGNRVGDSLFAKSASLKMFFDQYADRPNLTFRVTAVRIKSGLNIITATSLYSHPQSTNNMINPINTEAIELYQPNPVVFDKRFVVNNGGSNSAPTKDCHAFRQFFVKVNKKLKYNANQPNTIGPFAIQIVVTAYDSYGSLTSDNVCRLIYSRRAWFQDA